MAVDAFLKIDGIKGESKDHKHTGEIEISSWSWGASQQPVAGAGSTPSFHEFTFTHKLDKASPLLMQAVFSGKTVDGSFQGVYFTARKAGEKPLEYLKIKLEDVLISSVLPASTGGDRHTETVSFTFAVATVDYFLPGATVPTSHVYINTK